MGNARTVLAKTITPHWPIRSVLLVVANLERSVKFYEGVVGLREEFREDQLAVLAGDHWKPTLVLREGYRNALHPGTHAIGLCSLTFDVGGTDELDTVAQRLASHQALQCRGEAGVHGRLPYVRGHDPDRIPLFFVATNGTPTVADIRDSLGLLYNEDL